MPKYLVTGGCGFIGSHLAGDGALRQPDMTCEFSTTASTGRLHNAPAAAEVVVGDVGDHPQVVRAMQGVDGCFHLAAIASAQA